MNSMNDIKNFLVEHINKKLRLHKSLSQREKNTLLKKLTKIENIFSANSLNYRAICRLLKWSIRQKLENKLEFFERKKQERIANGKSSIHSSTDNKVIRSINLFRDSLDQYGCNKNALFVMYNQYKIKIMNDFTEAFLKHLNTSTTH